MTRRHRLLFGLILSVSTALLIVAMAISDSHRTNLRYLMWKHHLCSYQPDLSLRYLNVDVHFFTSLIGKSRSELKFWYPNITKVSPSDPARQHYKELVEQPGFMWLDHGSNWAIVFEDEKVKDIFVVKG